MRLAWFTPLAPVRSGISAYSAEILPLLRQYYTIDVYDEPAAFGFSWRHTASPYDLVVYQLGNASCHDYMWAYLVRHPGLVVLHDAQLHQSRALALLQRRWRPQAYQAEFAFSHPEAPIQVSNFVIDGSCHTLFNLWPMLKLAATRARVVAVHSRWLARDLRRQFPDTPIEHVQMGVSEPAMTGSADALRRRWGIPGDALVVTAFGRVTPEKRLGTIFGAVERVARERPVHLMLVGEAAPYYDVASELQRFGVEGHTTLAGFVDDGEVPAYLALSDVCVCLRWPSARETSASWLRCLAAGKPTIVTELSHGTEAATLEPYSWGVRPGALDDPSAALGPIAVGLDVVDEQHSLVHALRRLVVDDELRAQLGRRAREYWRRQHTLERMTVDYRRAVELALSRAAPPAPVELPHLTEDGTALARRLLGEIGVATDLF